MARAFGMTIFDEPIDRALEFSKQPGFYIFANAASWVSFCETENLKQSFQRARGIFADGMGTVLTSFLQGSKVHFRNPGPDFTELALKTWSTTPMAFVGGTTEGLKILSEKYQLSKTVQYIPPMREFSESGAREDYSELQKISEKTNIHPQILWVLLGCPKQELWADIASKINPELRIYCVGAAFDFLTHQKPRAPLWMRKVGLEWLHRLISEPARLYKRYLLGNVKLIFYSLLGRSK